MRWIWFVAGVVVCGGVPAPAAPPAPTAAAPVRVSEKEIPNFAVVAPGIWRGAAPTKDGLRRLKALGVRRVVDLRIERKGQESEAAACRELGLERTRIRMGREAPTAKQVAQFLALCDRSATSPVFIHCQHGADRTGAMVGIYRVSRQGWDYPRARAEMRRYGFKPWLHELEDSVRSRAGAPRPAVRR